MKRTQHLMTAAALCASWMLAGVAHAGSVQISVQDAEGKPAQDVVVLIEAAATSPKAAAVAASAAAVITQENLRFVPFVTVVPLGSSVQFVNRDSYDHHVRSTPSGPLGGTPPVSNFELRLSGVKNPGDAAKSSTIKLDKPGAIGLGCHLHSSMRGHLFVSNTPWFGKTDDKGQVSIAGVPSGKVEVSLQHPDQFQKQSPLQLQVTDAPVQATSKLNFVPRRRRG
jgi:plastocyanin